MTVIVVSPMAAEHLDAVAGLEARTYRRGWSRATFADELDRDGRTYLVALDGDRVVAYAGLMIVIDEAHITTVVVDPDVRRHGIARRLVLDLLRTARDGGAAAATLEVRAGNAAALSLYRQLGFAPVGVRPRYYAGTGPGDGPGSGEDAIIMWLADLQGTEVAALLEGS